MRAYHIFFGTMLSLVMLGFVGVIFADEIGRWFRGGPATSSPASTEVEHFFTLQAVYLGSQRNCTVTVHLTNRTNRTVSVFMGEIVLETEYGVRETGTYSIRYVDGGKSGEDTVSFSATCSSPPAAFEFRRIQFCELGGRFYSDCGRYVRVSSLTGRTRVHDFVNR